MEDAPSFIQAIEASGVSDWLRASLKALPIIEAIHVMAIATVFGTILIVDLRLLGYPNTQRPFTRFEHELVPWTWGAFGLAVVTGLLLFAPNATTYYATPAFWLKMITILCAGVNMAIFELVTKRSVAGWDVNTQAPLPARAAGALSITFWVAVICFARWIGFTKPRDFEIPEDMDFDFSFLDGALHLLNHAAAHTTLS
jgi:Zn-dependent protease with chaperone function